jgi:hypothetical protein
MGKKKKSNIAQQSKQKNYKRVESSVCEKCTTKCKEYYDYIRKLKDGKIGKGIICRKG